MNIKSLIQDTSFLDCCSLRRVLSASLRRTYACMAASSTCVYVWVCVRIYIYQCTYARVYACMAASSTCMYVWMHIYMHAYVCMCALVCIYASFMRCRTFYSNIHTYIRTYIHTYMHTCIHAYMHTCIHAYMHTCICMIHACMHTILEKKDAYITQPCLLLQKYILHHTHTHTYIHDMTCTSYAAVPSIPKYDQLILRP
jgi:hypothetical protein